MVLRLQYQPISHVPLEVEGVLPETTRELSLDGIRRLNVFLGNRTISLGEAFQVSGDPSDEQMDWEGDLSGVHWIGAKMTRGLMRVHGNAGRHVGSEMRGGTILVHGNAGDWVGAEMHGGTIHIYGHAAHLVGAAYRGSRRGMTEGVILVEGNVGNEVGHSMRRGLIAAAGTAGDLVGFNMLAGTILIFGPTGIRHGAGMRRGTLGLLSDQPPPLLPSFRFGCVFQPLMLSILEHHLRGWKFPLPEPLAGGDYHLYHGDFVTGGRGEILTRSPAAPA
jgi:formylmethanofuran dehydrogenase subunit C